MVKEFTSEEFEGYKFMCDYADANVGFKHVCKVYDRLGQEIPSAKAVINWGNRTWESYQYQSVFEQAKSLLRDTLNGEVDSKEGYNLDFLHRLAEEYYITDYGFMENGELVIMFDGWNQVKGHEHYDSETNKWVQDNTSVYAKLQALAEKNLLEPSINKTIKEVEFVFTDEYARCNECGRIFNTTYGELTIVDYEFYCDECLAENENAICTLISEAQEDFRKALKPTISEEKLEELGYVKLNEDSYSCSQVQWGETRYGFDYINMNFAEELCNAFGGFVKLDAVEQFDSPFSIWVQKDYEDMAKRSLEEGSIVTED